MKGEGWTTADVPHWDETVQNAHGDCPEYRQPQELREQIPKDIGELCGKMEKTNHQNRVLNTIRQ